MFIFKSVLTVFIKSVENYSSLWIFTHFYYLLFFNLLSAIPTWPAKRIKYIKSEISFRLLSTVGFPSFRDQKKKKSDWKQREKARNQVSSSLLDILSLTKTNKKFKIWQGMKVRDFFSWNYFLTYCLTLYK